MSWLGVSGGPSSIVGVLKLVGWIIGASSTIRSTHSNSSFVKVVVASFDVDNLLVICWIRSFLFSTRFLIRSLIILTPLHKYVTTKKVEFRKPVQFMSVQDNGTSLRCTMSECEVVQYILFFTLLLVDGHFTNHCRVKRQQSRNMNILALSTRST